ncbi:hypothetical protein QUO15_004412 [Vibrio parahaemolyticus]|nr:hypothetical protein [Vibrio parahaemolyticus]
MSKEKEFDEVVRKVEREETRGQAIDWRNDLHVATRIVERVEGMKENMPHGQRDELAKALERRVHMTIDIADGEPMFKDRLSARLHEQLSPMRDNPKLDEHAKEVSRLREIGEKAGGPDVKMAYAESKNSYAGRIVGMTDNYALQEIKDKPGHVIAHDRQAVSGAKLETGKDMEIRYPHGKAGLAKEAGREHGHEQQRHHETAKAPKQQERER